MQMVVRLDALRRYPFPKPNPLQRTQEIVKATNAAVNTGNRTLQGKRVTLSILRNNDGHNYRAIRSSYSRARSNPSSGYNRFKTLYIIGNPRRVDGFI